MSVPWDGKATKATIEATDIIPCTNGSTGKVNKFLGQTFLDLLSGTAASASTAGTMSSAHFTKLDDMDTKAALDAILAIVAQNDFFYPVETVANGTSVCFEVHTGGGTYTLGTFNSICSSGTVTLDIKKNGSTITGLGSISVSSTVATDTPSTTTTITAGDTLEVTFSSNSSCLGFRLTSIFTKALS